MPRRFKFDEFTVDAKRGGIWRGTTYVPLRPKTLSLLLFLAQNPSRLVTKDEIVEAVWPRVVATDESIAKCVSELRAALGSAGHRLVKTAPKRGYIFETKVVPIEEEASFPKCLEVAPVARTLTRAKANLRYSATMMAAFGVMLLLFVSFVARLSLPSSAIEAPSIAVLPFAEIGAEARRGYFGDGLAEDLAVSLGKFSELSVIAQDSSRRYAPNDASQAVGRDLGARYLLKGSVRRADHGIRVTAELIEAGSNRQVWAQRYDSPGADLFKLQDDLAEKIVTTLVAYVSRSELDRISKKRTANLDAYDLYLKGNATLRARNGPHRGQIVVSARRLFEKALDMDPSYAPAMDGLAYTYAVGFLERSEYEPLAGELGRTEVLGHALSLVRRSLELDPYRAQTHATAAWILHWLYRRHEALSEFERALELNPNLADGRFTHMLVHAGRPDDAIVYMQRLMKRDPFPPPIYLSYLGNAYYEAGRYDLAYRTLKDGFDALPGYRPLAVWLAASLAQLGRPGEAKPFVEEVVKGAPDFRVKGWLEHIRFANQADAERLAMGMKRAGFPE